MTDGELAVNRRAQDHVMADRHAGFNLATQEHTMKYERGSFTVVGEGSASALASYRANYSLIQWEESDEFCQHSEVLPGGSAGDEPTV